MIMVISATGSLGGRVVRRLLAQGETVRAVCRTPAKAKELERLGAEVMHGDLRELDSLSQACQGVEKIFTTAHGFPGDGDNNPRTVDDVGNRQLIDAARTAGVKHFVFTSILGVRPDAPVDFFRYKYAAEEYLRASGLSYTILRPSAFMETWAAMVGGPIVATGKTTIFGHGNNPINFVSVDDVAQFALIALSDPRACYQIIEIGGPGNLTLNQVAELFEQVSGRTAQKNHVPLPMMRVMSMVMRPIKPVMARQIAAGIYMDTAKQAFDVSQTLQQYPVRLTCLQDFVRKTYA